MRRALAGPLSFVTPPLLVFVLVLLLWDAAVLAFGIPPFLLPRPWRVFGVAWVQREALLLASGLTALAALTGFVCSFVVGCLTAFLFSQSRLIQRSLFPYAIFLQTVPIVAVAPLIITWFGDGFQSVVLIAFIIGLFPIITNGTAGLLSVDRNLIDLFRLNNASRWQLLWKLRLPNAAPYLVTGAKVSSGLSVIGAIVGELFAGFATEWYGLGYLIIMNNKQMRIDYSIAAVLASTLLGLLIFTMVGALGRALLARWHESEGQP